MIDHDRIHARLRAARQSRTGAIEDITASKKQLSDAEAEIEECLKEIETDEPVRPLLDRIERAAPPVRDPAEQPTAGGTDFHGRRGRAPRKTATVSAERPDRKLRPTSPSVHYCPTCRRAAEAADLKTALAQIPPGGITA